MKQITITVPNNCELKQDGNTYTIVEKEKKITYDDVAKVLFPFNEKHIYITVDGSISTTKTLAINYDYPNNVTSEKQAEKLLAINKLMNVAKYLNDGWQPDWNDTCDNKWFIYFSNEYEKLDITCVCSMQQHFIYFKAKELAMQAIEILGEETIKLALCTDY